MIMKKLVSFLLVLCILCPLLSGCVWLDEDTRMKRAYLRQFGIKDKKPEDVIVDYDGGTYNGARIVMLDAEWHDPEESVYEIPFMASINYYDSNRLYVYKYGYFFTLKQAYEYSILERSDIEDIAVNYSAEITAFIDVCDKYDFEPCQEIRIGDDHIDHADREICESYLWICFDERATPSMSLPAEPRDVLNKIAEYINTYVGCDVISGISILYGYEPYANGYVFDIYIKNDSIENLPKIMEQIASVPGVKWVYCHCLYFFIGLQAANDTYYDDGQWGLNI